MVISITQQIIQIIRPIYELLKNGVREAIKLIITILVTLKSMYEIVVNICTAINDIFTFIVNLRIHINPIDIPGAIAAIPGIGDIAKAFASLLNPVINAINTIFDFINKLAVMTQLIVQALISFFKMAINLNEVSIKSMLYFQNNPGVVIYFGSLGGGFILSCTPIAQLVLPLISSMPLIWIISIMLLIFSPIIIYGYFKFTTPQTTSSGIDPLVTSTEDTLLFTDRGSEIFYPILYIFGLGGFYGAVFSEFFISFFAPHIPTTLLLTMEVLPLIPAAIYLYYFIQDPSKALRNWLAEQFNLLPTDNRFDNILALQTSSEFIHQTSDDLRNAIQGQFSLTDTQMGLLDQIQVLISQVGKDTLGFLGDSGADTIRQTVAAILTIGEADPRWDSVTQFFNNQVKGIISEVMEGVITTFKITTTPSNSSAQNAAMTALAQQIRAAAPSNLNFLSSADGNYSFRLNIQELTNMSGYRISLGDARWSATNNPLHATKIVSQTTVSNLTEIRKLVITIVQQSIANSATDKALADVTWSFLDKDTDTGGTTTKNIAIVDPTAILKTYLADQMWTDLDQMTNADQMPDWINTYNNQAVGFNNRHDLCAADTKYINVAGLEAGIGQYDASQTLVQIPIGTTATSSTTTTNSTTTGSTSKLFGVTIVQLTTKTTAATTNTAATTTTNVSKSLGQRIISDVFLSFTADEQTKLLALFPKESYSSIQYLDYTKGPAIFPLIMSNIKTSFSLTVNNGSVINPRKTKLDDLTSTSYKLLTNSYAFTELKQAVSARLLIQSDDATWDNTPIKSSTFKPAPQLSTVHAGELKSSIIQAFCLDSHDADLLGSISILNLGQQKLSPIGVKNSIAVMKLTQFFADTANQCLIVYILALIVSYSLYDLPSLPVIAPLIELLSPTAKVILQLLPLVPGTIFLLLLFWGKKDYKTAVLLIKDSVSFKNDYLALIYPIVYLIGLYGYYKAIASELFTKLVGEVSAPVNLTLYTLPLLPLVDYFFQMLTLNKANLKTDGIMGIIDKNAVMSINQVRVDFTSKINLLSLVYLYGLRFYYSITMSESFSQSLPYTLVVLLQVLPLIPIALYIYARFFLKTDHYEAMSLVLDTISFRNYELSLFYPFIYLGILIAYFMFLISLPETISGFIPGTLLFVLFVTPLFPVVLYVYRFFQPSMPFLCQEIATQIGIDVSTVSRIPSLQSLNTVNNRSTTSIKLEIITALSLDPESVKSLDSVPYLQTNLVTSFGLKNALTIGATLKDLLDKYNICTYAYLIFIRGYSELMTTSLVSSITGTLDAIVPISTLLYVIPMIPLITLTIFIALSKKLTRNELVKNIDLYLSLFGDYQNNQDVIGYTVIAMSALTLLIFSESVKLDSDTNTFIKSLLLIFLTGLLLPLFLFINYLIRTSNIKISINNTRSVIKILFDTNVIKYTVANALIWSLYFGTYLDPILNALPDQAKLIIQVLLLLNLLPVIVFFYNLIFKDRTAADSLSGAENLLPTMSFSSITLKFGLGKSDPDRNPDLTPVEKFFFGMLYGESPQSGYYSPDQSAIVQIKLASQTNFTQLYSLQELNLEFFNSEAYQLDQYSQFQSARMTRLEYIKLPITLDKANSTIQSDLEKLIIKLIGNLSNVTDQTLLSYANGADGNQLAVIPGAPVGPKQGLANSNFILQQLDLLKQTYVKNNTVYDEVVSRIDSYIAKFAPLAGTAFIRSPDKLKTFLYQKSNGTAASIIQNQAGVEYIIEPDKLLYCATLFNSTKATLINNLAGSNGGSLTNNADLFYKVILANVPVKSLQPLLLDQRSLCVKYLFETNNGVLFDQFYGLTPISTLETAVYKRALDIVNGSANDGTRALMKTISTNAANGLVMTTSLDPYIMQSFYNAAVLLNQVYTSLYQICGKFNPNSKMTDALDLISFRGSVSKFDWPQLKDTTQSKRYASITQIKLEIMSNCQFDTSVLSQIDNLPIFKNTSLVQNNTIDILMPNILELLTTAVASLYKDTPAAAFKLDVISALQLNASDILKLSSISEFNSGILDVTDTVSMNKLKTKIATVLGLTDGALLRSRIITALNLTTTSDLAGFAAIQSIKDTTIDLLDDTKVQNIKTDIVNFIANSARIITNIKSGLLLTQSEEMILKSLTIFQSTLVNLENPNLKELLKVQVIDAFNLNKSSAIKQEIKTKLGLNITNTLKLDALAELSGITVDISNPDVVQSIKLGVRGIFQGGSSISSQQIKDDLINSMQLTNTEIVKLNTVLLLQADSVSRGSLDTLRSSIISIMGWDDGPTALKQIRALYIPNVGSPMDLALTGLGSAAVSPYLSSTSMGITIPGRIDTIKSKVIEVAGLNADMGQQLERIRGLSQNTFDALDFANKYVNVDLIETVRSLSQATLTTLAFQEIQPSSDILARLIGIQGLSGLSKPFAFSNNQAIKMVNLIYAGMSKLPSINQDLIQLLSNQDETSFNYWLNGMKNCKNNWLSLYKIDLELDSISGKPKEIGFQTGCPKVARETLHTQYTQILSELETSLYDPVQGDILKKLSTIVDLLAPVCQFFYTIKEKSSASDDYTALLNKLNQYFANFINFDNNTFSLFSLMSPEYEYSHFVINLPLNLNPLVVDQDFDTLDSLNELVTQNLYNNAEYQQTKNEIIRSFVIKVLLDMVWWQDFVLWYYPLPDKLGKEYLTSSSRLNYTYLEDLDVTKVIKSRTWNSEPEALNRFKYTSNSPILLSPIAGSYNGSNGVIGSILRLKQNPGIWIGNGCIGYGMHQIFLEWSRHLQNNLITMLSTSDYTNLREICLSGDFSKYISAYKHDVILGYVFITTTPFTYNRFNLNYSWQDLRRTAFSGLDTATFPTPDLNTNVDLYKLMCGENRKVKEFNSRDEYINSLTATIPVVYFNSNLDGPSDAPNSPLFQRSCIDNLDFGNSIFYGISSMSQATNADQYGNLGYRYIYASNGWPFGATQNSSVKNDILTKEARYYLNSFDWLSNRSCIGSNLTISPSDSHLLKPATLANLWENPKLFLQNPLSFLDLNRSYQLYPLQSVSDPDYFQVFGEGDTKPSYVRRPAFPEFSQLGWITPSEPGDIPYATLVVTNWKIRFGSK